MNAFLIRLLSILARAAQICRGTSFVSLRALLILATYLDFSDLFQLNKLCAAIYKKEGLFRFYDAARPVLAIFKAEAVEDILTSNVILDKGLEYNIIHPWLGTGLLTSTGSKWRSRRRLLTPAFHFRVLEDFLPTINEQSQIFVQNLRHQGEKGLHDIVPLVKLCTLDIICETIMGYKMNAQTDQCMDYVQGIQFVGKAFTRRLESPLYWVDAIFRLSSPGRLFFKNVKMLHEFTTKVIRAKKQELLQNPPEDFFTKEDDTDMYGLKSEVKRPFLHILLREHLRNPEIFTEENVREEVDTFMFEGHDTTAMGISWALFLIGLYPKCQSRVHSELDSIFGEDKSRPVTMEDLKRMKYLECCLKESQRLYPSVPIISRRCEEDVTVDGRTLPKGSTVQVLIHSLHRNEQVFPKPEEFLPERFSPENSRGRHHFAYIPFSAGPRNCIGQRFAMMELKIVIANVLRNYWLISLHERDQVLELSEMVLRPKDGLNVKCVPR